MPGPQPSILNMRSGQNAVATPQTCIFAPMGRYFIVRATNADAVNAQGAGAFVRITAYPFI